MRLILFAFLVSCLLSCKKDDPEPDLSQTYQEPTKVYIYSVTATPTASESITLKNNSGGTVDITGWTLGDLNDPTAYNIPNSTILAQGQTITFSHTTLGFQINDSGETIYLKDDTGTTIDNWYN